MSEQVATQEGCLIRINRLYNSLKPAERRVAAYILENWQKSIHLSITDLSENCGTSETTVVRFCRHLGYRGFQHLKIQLAQDIVPPLSNIHEDLEEGDDFQSLIWKVFRASGEAIQDTYKNLDKEQFEKAAEAVSKANKILFYGVGGSGVVAKDAEHKFMKIGIECHAYPDIFMQAISAAMLNKGDVVIGISHSGSTKAICESLKNAQNSGATIIAITQSSRTPITKLADIVLYTYSREAEVRNEAMSSRIAQLCLLDSLYLAAARHHQERILKNLQLARVSLIDKRY